MNSLLFILEDDALIVANTGRAFTREGVISICDMDLSSKSTIEAGSPEDEYGEQLIDSIRKDHLKEYAERSRRLKGDGNSERRVNRGYAGRFVFELLQNAEDAANASQMEDSTDVKQENARYIGHKGLGFKSVLEITEEPEIYSGDFFFHFSKEKSLNDLKKSTKFKDEWMPPIFRLPYEVESPDEAVQKMFRDGYTTVIRLPIIDGKYEYVERKLSEFDKLSLLFCQHLESVQVQIRGKNRRIMISRLEGGQAVAIAEDGDIEYWRVWRKTRDTYAEKQISVSVCLPIDNDRVKACREKLPLYVFFPTEEKISGVHALIHASCEVEDNRKHLSVGQPHGEEIGQLLKDITRTILLEVPANVALQAFGDAHTTEGEEIIEKLTDSILETVQETPFVPVIGGGRARPCDVRVWDYNLGNVVQKRKVKGKNLCSPEMIEESRILCDLGAHHMPYAEQAELLQFCRNATMADCLRVWNLAQLLMKKTSIDTKEDCAMALRKAPFWWTTSGLAREIDCELTLVWEEPQYCPDWLTLDVVGKDFVKRITKEEQLHRKNNKEWKNALVDSKIEPLRKKKELFDNILLPYCKDESQDWWKGNGFSVLKTALAWGVSYDNSKKLITPVNWIEIIEIFHLPVIGDSCEWKSVRQCYAGTAWGGPEIFDSYFDNIDNRYIVSPLDEWGINYASYADESAWKDLLLYLSCAWQPRIYHLDTWAPGRDDWSDVQSPYSANNITDYYFDHFDQMLPREPNGTVPQQTLPLSIIRDMCANIANYHASYRPRTAVRHCRSHAQNQLTNNSFVPCRSSLLYPDRNLFPPGGTYLPGCGLGGLLPEVDEGWLSEGGIEGKKALVRLGANSSITQDRGQLINYMNKLSICAAQDGADLRWKVGAKDERSEIARSALKIFSSYEKFHASQLDRNVMIPCISHTNKGEYLRFAMADNVYWADKPYFDDPGVRRKILAKDDLFIFFRFLRDGECYGLKKLSKFLDMEIYQGKPLPHKSEELRERYKLRRDGLVQVVGEGVLPESLNIHAYDGLTLVSNKYNDIRPQVKFWAKSEEFCVDIDAGDEADEWRGLVAALAAVGDCALPKGDLVLLLKEENLRGFLDLLRDEHNITEESLSKMDELSPPQMDRVEDGRETYSDGTGVSRDVSTYEDDKRQRPSSIGGSRTSNRDDDYESSYHSEQRSMPTIKIVNYDAWKTTDSQRGAGSELGSDQDQNEAKEAVKDRARDAEMALYELLCEQFGPDKVEDMNEENPDNPGFDILVRINGEDHYYECKSFVGATPPRWVRMSAEQMRWAQQHKEYYKLCVIYDTNASEVSMLPPICNPSVLDKKPAVYKLDLASRKRDSDS